MKKYTSFIVYLFFTWTYGLINIATNFLEFKDRFFNSKVNNSFSFYDVIFNAAFLYDFISYLFWFLVLYSLIAVISFFLSTAILKRFNIPDRSKLLGRYLVLCVVLYTIALINAHFFPLTSTLKPNMGHMIIPVVFFVFCTGVLVVEFCLKLKTVRVKAKKKIYIVCLAACLLLGVLKIVDPAIGSKENKPHDLPNIIIIGIDSLRPDLLPAASFEMKAATADCENINRFLEKACVFPNTLTAFGRTFPSWISLLTGKYPVNNKARFNLIGQSQVIENNFFLPQYLKQKGYTTVYASDEKRFCNIDQRHGFDIVTGPRAGAADFLLAPVFEAPLINLIVNSRIGRFMFPYNHANRAIGSTYNPASFIRLLDKKLDSISDSPVFMAVHLCLSHWPYDWAHSNSQGGNTEKYLESISRADKQFDSVVKILEKQFLDNALVFLISDHGESLSYLEGGETLKYLNGEEKFVNPKNNQLFEVNALGHGSYVPDRGQFNVLMGVRGFGKVKNKIGKIRQSASLIDIFPTIVSVINDHPARFNFDGMSLMNWIRPSKNEQEKVERFFYLESGYTKNIFQSAKSLDEESVKDIVSSGIDNYSITQDGHIVLKNEAVDRLMKQKQYAVIKEEKSVVILPEENEVNLIGLDYSKKEWVKLDPNEPHSNYGYNTLLKHLVTMYRDEPVISQIDSKETWEGK